MRNLLLLSIFIVTACSSLNAEKKEKALLHLQLGNSFYESGNYPYALRELLQGEELDPSNPLIQNNLGLVYFVREKYDLSVEHFKKAIAAEKNYTDAKNNLARVYIEQKKFAEAEKELNYVLKDLTYANFEKAYINLGLCYFNQNRFEKAKEIFSKALEINRENCISLNYYGRSYFELKNYSAASDSLDRAIDYCQKIDFDEPHYYSALSYFRLGNREKSTTRFTEIIKLYPNGKYKDKAQSMLDLIKKGVQ